MVGKRKKNLKKTKNEGQYEHFLFLFQWLLSLGLTHVFCCIILLKLYGWRFCCSVRHEEEFKGCKIEAGVNGGARGWMEVSLRCHNSPRRYWVTRCWWRHVPEARGSLCENLKKMRVEIRHRTKTVDFWSSQTRGELAP